MGRRRRRMRDAACDLIDALRGGGLSMWTPHVDKSGMVRVESRLFTFPAWGTGSASGAGLMLGGRNDCLQRSVRLHRSCCKSEGAKKGPGPISRDSGACVSGGEPSRSLGYGKFARGCPPPVTTTGEERIRDHSRGGSK